MAAREGGPPPRKKWSEWGRIEDWALLIVLTVIAWQALGFLLRAILGDWFRQHEDFCFYVWIVLPFCAFRLQDAQVRSRLRLSARNVRVLRDGMLAIAITLSMGFLFHNNPQREHAANWFESLRSWGLGWLYLITWIAVPAVTWMFANKALAQARAECAKRDT